MRLLQRLSLIGLLIYAAPYGVDQSNITELGAEQSRPISFVDHRVTALNALARVASENRIPTGLILGAEPKLCAIEKDIRVRAVDPLDAFEQILTGTGYTVNREENVLVVKPPDPTPHEQHLLDFRFERFSATDSNVSDAGALLGGYIVSVAEGTGGFATAIPIPQDKKTFNVRLLSATTQEIANRIVSLGDKGMWVFYPTPEPDTARKAINPIRLFAYGEEIAQFKSLGCTLSTGEPR